MKRKLFKRLQQVIARDHINDKERLAALKDAQDLMVRIKSFYTSRTRKLLLNL